MTLPNTDTKRSPEAPPIVCTLSDAALAKRQEEISGTIFSAVQEITHLPDGYAFRFEGSEEWAHRLMGFILTERECCPFFTFELRFEPDGGSIWLHLRGSPETKSYVGSLIGPKAMSRTD